MYEMTTRLIRVVCRDTESVHSADKFALAGASFTDIGKQGFMFPTTRINDGEERALGKGTTLQGTTPHAGLVLFGYDIDENDSWKDNEADIVKGAGAITTGLALIPPAAAAAAVIGTVSAAVISVLKTLISFDKNDVLLDFRTVYELVPGPVGQPLRTAHRISFNHDDWTGYSSWDYYIDVEIDCVQLPEKAPLKIPVKPEAKQNVDPKPYH